MYVVFNITYFEYLNGLSVQSVYLFAIHIRHLHGFIQNKIL